MTTNATSTAGLLTELAARISQDSDLQSVAATLAAGNNAVLDGICGSSCALAASSLAVEPSFDCCLIIVSEPKQSELMALDLEIFSDSTIEVFPALDATSGRSALMDEAYGERLRLLKLLARGDGPRFVVTSIQALQQPVPSIQEVADQTRLLKTGKSLDVDGFSQWLIKHDYHHTTAVELPGEFCVRGGIIDIFATDWIDPVRIEMFGDEIDSMRRFDRASQRSLMSLEEVEVTVLTKQRPRRSHFVEYLPKQLFVVMQQPDEINQEGKTYLERISDFDRHHSVHDVLKSLKHCPTVST